jgi:hypothetical protein
VARDGDDLYLPTVRVKQSAYTSEDMKFLQETEAGETSTVDWDKAKRTITDHLTMTIQLVPHKVLKRQFNYLVIMVVCLLAIMIGLTLFIVQAVEKRETDPQITSVSQTACNMTVHYSNGQTQTLGPFCH